MKSYTPSSGQSAAGTVTEDNYIPELYFGSDGCTVHERINTNHTEGAFPDCGAHPFYNSGSFQMSFGIMPGVTTATWGTSGAGYNSGLVHYTPTDPHIKAYISIHELQTPLLPGMFNYKDTTKLPTADENGKLVLELHQTYPAYSIARRGCNNESMVYVRSGEITIDITGKITTYGPGNEYPFTDWPENGHEKEPFVTYHHRIITDTYVDGVLDPNKSSDVLEDGLGSLCKTKLITATLPNGQILCKTLILYDDITETTDTAILKQATTATSGSTYWIHAADNPQMFTAVYAAGRKPEIGGTSPHPRHRMCGALTGGVNLYIGEPTQVDIPLDAVIEKQHIVTKTTHEVVASEMEYGDDWEADNYGFTIIQHKTVWITNLPDEHVTFSTPPSPEGFNIFMWSAAKTCSFSNDGLSMSQVGTRSLPSTENNSKSEGDITRDDGSLLVDITTTTRTATCSAALHCPHN